MAKESANLYSTREAFYFPFEGGYEKKFFPPRPKYKPNSPPLTFVCEVIIQTLDLMLQGRFNQIDKISRRKRVYFSN